MALPIQIDAEAEKILQAAWEKYHAKTLFTEEVKAPNRITDIIASINAWLKANTSLCEASGL